MQLIDRVRDTIRRHDLAPRGSRVIVAVSGGSDSVALSHLMMSLDRAGDLHVAAFAHFNHQLRADADRDERFCAGLAASLGRAFVADRGDVAMLARRERRSIEDAARHARYEFLERACVEADAGLIALGHTRDDQAETFLLRLLRGAGARGLAAMHPRRGPMIRPLIDCRRSELRDYLAEHRIAFVDDASNEDVSIPAIAYAELLPLLIRRFNPSIVDGSQMRPTSRARNGAGCRPLAAMRLRGVVRGSGCGDVDGYRRTRRAADRAGRMVARRGSARAGRGGSVPSPMLNRCCDSRG